MNLSKQESKDLLTALVFTTTMTDMDLSEKERKRLLNLFAKIAKEAFVSKPKLKNLSRPDIIDDEDIEYYKVIEQYVKIEKDKDIYIGEA